MFPLSVILSPLSVLLSLSTATGVLVHDTGVDKAVMTAAALPAVVAGYELSNKSIKLGGTDHTHTERGSLAQAVRDVKSQNPRVQPRGSEDKKHLMQKFAPRGHHAFDNYNLPIV